MRKTIERNLESGIFASRWLLAPFYAGPSVSLLVRTTKICFMHPQELGSIMPMARAHFVSAASHGRIIADLAALRGLLLLIRP